MVWFSDKYSTMALKFICMVFAWYIKVFPKIAWYFLLNHKYHGTDIHITWFLLYMWKHQSIIFTAPWPYTKVFHIRPIKNRIVILWYKSNKSVVYFLQEFFYHVNTMVRLHAFQYHVISLIKKVSWYSDFIKYRCIYTEIHIAYHGVYLFMFFCNWYHYSTTVIVLYLEDAWSHCSVSWRCECELHHSPKI